MNNHDLSHKISIITSIIRVKIHITNSCNLDFKGSFGTNMHNARITNPWISNAYIRNAEFSNAGVSFYEMFVSLFPT